VRSLRARLLVGLLGLLSAMSIIAGIAAYVLDRNEVDEWLDGQLRQIAMNVGDTDYPLAVREGDGVSIEPEDEVVVTIWNRSGQAHSSDASYQVVKPEATGYANFEAMGEEWRAYTWIDGDRAVQVAQRMAVREEFATNSAVRAVLPIAALIPLSWLLVSWLVGRLLRPLHRVTKELRGWGKAATNPLPVSGVPSEIMPLALATNDLITRLQSQLEFREQFISDAAHELRTPLTALRLQVRNLAESAGSSEQALLIADMGAGVRRMSDMVGKLLQLARADASAPIRNPVAVDIGEALAGSLQDVIPVAAEKGIDVGVVATTADKVLADPEELRTLIGNLVDNAVRYTSKGGVIDLSIERLAAEIVFEVRDTGPGIPKQLLDHVFGRFVRLPGTESEGSGLGLPIVKAIAERCGAKVTLINRQDRSGLVARVTFAPAHAGADTPASATRP
jgi:two-component system OmpR family sensor kinase